MTTKAELERESATGGSYFGYVEITEPDVPPFVMFTNGDDCTVSTKYLREKAFEPASLQVWAAFARQATSIFDIGAHAGIYSLIAAHLRPELKIQAFEPNPDVYARLIINITANRIANIVPHRAGIGHMDGLLQLGWLTKRLGHLSSGARYILPNTSTDGATTVAAQMRRLEGVAAELDLGSRPLMKIDVEGNEEFVFSGMGDVLSKRPDIILETFSWEACQRITAATKPLGYSYFVIDEPRRSLVKRDALYPATGDSMNQLLTTRNLPDAR